MGRQRSDRQTPRVAGAPAEGERPPDSRQGGLHQGGLRAAGIATARLAAPILSRHQGGVLGRLKAEWAAIVGAQLAAATWPAALGRDGALKLRVASNLALDLQHRAPLMIERINRFLGRDAVVRLVLVQGPLPLPPHRRRLRHPRCRPRRRTPSTSSSATSPIPGCAPLSPGSGVWCWPARGAAIKSAGRFCPRPLHRSSEAININIW